jgi:hypothetical protein
MMEIVIIGDMITLYQNIEGLELTISALLRGLIIVSGRVAKSK